MYAIIEEGGKQFKVTTGDTILIDRSVEEGTTELKLDKVLLVGGGGATTRPMRVDTNKRGPFSAAAHGFADLSFTADQATVKLVGENGAILHSFTRDKAGNVTIVEAGKSDPPTPRSVKSITRGGSEVPEAKKPKNPSDD